MRWVLLCVLFLGELKAEDTVSVSIDKAIELTQAGSGDIATQNLQALLHRSLSSVERATILYNLSVLSAIDDKFPEALSYLDQIDSSGFESLVSDSPQVALLVCYNGTICALRYCQNLIAKIVKTQSLQHGDLESLQKALDDAKRYNQQLLTLSPKEADEPIPLPTLLAYNQEQIADIGVQISTIETIRSMFDLNKQQLAEALSDYLHAQIETLCALLDAKSSSASTVGLYVQEWGASHETILSVTIARMLRYLQAPASHAESGLNRFLSENIATSESALHDAIAQKELEAVLKSLSALTFSLQVIQAKSDIEALLQARIDSYFTLSFQEKGSKLFDFWQETFDACNQFAIQYVELKKSFISDKVQQACLAYLEARLEQKNSVLDDLAYWKLINQEPTKSFSDLAGALHGAFGIDHSQVDLPIQAVTDRLKAQALDVGLLADAQKEQSALLLFQDVVESWYGVDPKAALNFLYAELKGEIDLIQNQKADSWTQFIAHTDFQLLMHLIKGQKEVSDVRQDLLEHGGWFSDQKRQDLDYYALSLELGWVDSMLVDNVASIESATNMVDFGVAFQQTTLSLVRYSGTEQFSKLLNRLTSMQETLTKTEQKNLKQYEDKNDQIKKVQELLTSTLQALPEQTRQLNQMQNVLDLLSQASTILHSMKSHAQTEESQKSQLTQNEDLTMQMQRKALQLTPQNSIRLLQEMQREDRSLEEQPIPQVTVERPW